MDKRHFERYYIQYVGRIYKFVLYRVGGNRALAEDLTQDIFLKAFRAFESFDPAFGQVAWLYTIARNHVINHYAKNRPQASLEDVDRDLTLAVRADVRSVAAYDEQRMLSALDRLQPDDAQLLRMKYLEGWSFDDLEQIFDKRSGALRVQAGRALKKLRQELKQF